MEDIVTISSEDDAFEAIKLLISRKDFQGDVQLDGWPKLQIKLVGEQFDSSITPSVMKSFLELQSLVYKSYAITRYDTDDVRKLSKEEREELEIKVTVEPGSSMFEVDLQEILVKFAEQAGQTMTPEMTAVTVLGLGVLWVGRTSFSAYLNYRKEVRLSEAGTEEQKAALDAVQAQSKQETERLQLLTKLLVKQPMLDQVKDQVYDAHTEMLKGFSTADTATIEGLTVDSDVADELLKNARRKATEERVDGYYRIIRVDSSNPDVFRVRVRRKKSATEFDAVLQDDSLDEQKKLTLQFAEWERTTVFLSINAKVMDGVIKEATILDATAVEPSED